MDSVSYEKAFSSQQCDKIVSDFGYEPTLEASSVYGRDGSPVSDESMAHIRSSSVHWIDIKLEINKVIWELMLEANSKFFNYNIHQYGGEQVQFSKYGIGDFYEWHKDYFDKPDTHNLGQVRKLSVTVELSDPDSYEGGILEFYNGKKTPIRPVQSKGVITVFDSREWHRVTKITKGTRYSLVMWCRGENFK